MATEPISLIERGCISSGQRAAMFAAASRIGLNIADLRSLTPKGSISRLTFDEASALLSRLNNGTAFAHPRRPRPRGPRRPKGVFAIATPAQRRKIEALAIQLTSAYGWTAERFNSWLSERTHVDGRPMTRVDSTRDANAVIELLKAVLAKANAAAPASDPGDDAPPF